MSIMIDSDRGWRAQLARLRSLLAADREQERQIDRRQEHQSVIVGIGDYNAAMVLVDSDASRMLELEVPSTLLADARQERLVAQRPRLYAVVEAINNEDAIMIVIYRKSKWTLELAWFIAFLAELGHERAIVTREYLRSMIAVVSDEQETSMMVERQANWSVELAIGIACLLGANRELDSSISIKRSIECIVCHQSSNRESSQRQEMLANVSQTPKTPNQRGDALTTRELHRRERHQATPTQRATSDER